MLGGFLGAGKTTTLLKLALWLRRQGLRVGMITNDQAEGLVDSVLAEELDLPVREIAGGCFCCRSESLVEALGRLEKESQPQVFLAEPVGSCTDLVATVSLPLERIYRKGFVMAPYVVVVDPYRAMQSLGVEEEPLFSPDVNYIYRKQLEEAEIIAINKVDVIAPERLAVLKAALEREYPEARILEIASRDGTGVEELFQILTDETGATRKVMTMDYERYAEGEALLGWVNIQGRLGPRGGMTETAPMGDTPHDGDEWLMALAAEIAERLRERGIEVAHLKLSLAGTADTEAGDGSGSGQGSGGGRLAAVQWVRSGVEPELTRRMSAPFTRGSLLINLRAEADPDTLAAETFSALAGRLEVSGGLELSSLATQHFRPGKPVPTHRVDSV